MRRLKQKSMFSCFGGNQQKEFSVFSLNKCMPKWDLCNS